MYDNTVIEYASTNGSAYGEVVDVACLPGYEFINPALSQSITCLVDTNKDGLPGWLPDNETLVCKRAYKTFLLHSAIKLTLIIHILFTL